MGGWVKYKLTTRPEEESLNFAELEAASFTNPPAVCFFLYNISLIYGDAIGHLPNRRNPFGNLLFRTFYSTYKAFYTQTRKKEQRFI
jgi:hypothetical protein